MSSQITVFAVSVDRLKEIVGSRDHVLLESILAKQKQFLSRIGDIDDEVEATCAEAVADLVNGVVSKNTPAFLYGYALKAICLHVGTELPNFSSITGGSNWIYDVDDALNEKYIPFRLADLFFSGSPIDIIPRSTDYPWIGKWPASDVPTAPAAFRGVDLTDLDPDMAETLEQIRGWLEEAAKKPGDSLIGFLS